MKKIAFLTLFLLSSCSAVKVNGQLNVRYEKVGDILKECQKILGKEVFVKATYCGWNCSSDCGKPPLTRSDTCIKDETGCIYLKGTAGLDPFTAKGREYLFKGKVKKNREGICYLEVLKVNEVK